MIKDIIDAQNALRHNQNRLAFIVGNGINRFAYGGGLNVSWEGLLLDVWRENLRHTLSSVYGGITNTELYDMMEFEAKPAVLLDSVVSKVRNWARQDYHSSLQTALQNWGKPVLTTNFDSNLEEGLNKVIVKPIRGGQKFTDYYPWNVVYTNNRDFAVHNIYDFGIWHINGMVEYKRSLRLSLSQYMLQSMRAAGLIHSAKSFDDNFYGKNQEIWCGHNTWLHLVFNCDLCIFGLSLDTQETFLRWLLIERAKYFYKFRERIRHGWYVGTSADLTPGKQLFLEKIGFEIIELESYEKIYNELLNVQ